MKLLPLMAALALASPIASAKPQCYTLTQVNAAYELCLDEVKKTATVKPENVRCMPTTYSIERMTKEPFSLKAYVVIAKLTPNCGDLEIVPKSQIHFLRDYSLQITWPRGSYVFWYKAKN